MDSKTTTLKDDVERLLKSRNDIEREIRRARNALLRSLPESLGFDSLDELIEALVPLASAATKARWREPARQANPNRAKGKRFDSHVRARVRHQLEVEKASVSAVARETGVSLATLHKWRKEWGLVSRGAVARGNGTTAGSTPEASQTQ